MAKKKKKVPKFRLEMGWGGVLLVITGAFAAILWTFVLGVWVGKKVAGPKEELNLASLEATSPPSQRKEPPLFTVEGSSPFDEKKAEGPRDQDSTGKAKGEGEASNISNAPITSTPPVERPIQEEIVGSEAEPTKEETKSSHPQAPVQEKVTGPKTSPAKAVKTQKRLSKSRPRPYFALQVASFRELKYAQKEVIRWKNLGYSATIKKVDLGPKKGTWYRVFVGKYATIAEARKGAVELAKKFRQKSYIRPVR